LHEVFKLFWLLFGVEVAECVEECFGIVGGKLGEVEYLCHLCHKRGAVEILYSVEGIVNGFVYFEKGNEGFYL